MLLNHSALHQPTTPKDKIDEDIKILLVDDRPENLTALEALLADTNYHLYYALNGFDAVELTKKHDFAVILLDVQMPQLDGFQTAALIRTQHSHTPIIFVTAIHRDLEFETKGYFAGAVDYLFKPVNPQILKSKVSIFAELKKKTLENERHAELLRQSSLKEQENRLLKEALAARDEFLSVVSHELKTPMTPLNLQIQAFLKIFDQDQAESPHKEVMKRLLKTSESQVQRLNRLVDDLLNVTRIQSGRLEISKETVNLNELVDSVLQSFNEVSREKNCEVRFHASNTVFAVCDRFRLEQVIINLLTNAFKYGNCKPIEICLYAQDSNAVFEIKDQGIGISAEDQARIFERFERAVSSRSYGGLGLGLYISNEIVRLHGGRIEIESEVSKGSTFRVILPVQ
jgi:signal transduction histidine kinase